MRVPAFVCALVLAACDAPDHADCLSACDAQNMCVGATQQRCSGLCNAKPRDCTAEYTDYWTCAGTHLNDACNAFSNSCADTFAKYSSCVTAFCLANPLDSNCYY
jgi:hypothetical protein